ncbi:hypothetical protein OAJ27_00520 [bacterium]|nr:hypothetical protein [bacterium]
MHLPSSVLIVGAGWLGLPLATKLSNTGIPVHVTKRHKCSLNISNIRCYQLLLDDVGNMTCADRNTCFKPNTLIITLPFKRTFEDPQSYVRQLTSLISAYCEVNTAKKNIIFTSSTSIYGSSSSTVTENSVIKCRSQREQALYDAEHFLLHHPDLNTTILRCGGLFGYDRRIGNFSKERLIKNARSPVNLIHRDDVIGIMLLLLQRPIQNCVYNAVCNHHPSKLELYGYHSQHEHLAEPQYDTDSFDIKMKCVDGTKVCTGLGYSFIYSDLLQSYL